MNTISDPVQILLSHDEWATRQIIEACRPLTQEQFHRAFEMGPGSLQKTLTHILAATRTWTETLAGAAPTPRLETDGVRRGVDELLALLGPISGALAAEVRRLPLSEMATRTLRDGRTITITRGAIAMHVATHAMHHRAQCLNMLRRLGVSPLPPSSVTEWTWAG